MTDNALLKSWVDEMAALCGPEKVVWLDGSEDEKRRLEGEAVSSRELIALDPERHPGCFYHRTDPRDVVRTEHLTFTCTRRQEDAGPTNVWMRPEEGYQRAAGILRGSMAGRTMYVVAFLMGPPGSPFAKVGVQLTDSLYICLNMRIMSRIGAPALKALGPDGSFTKCVHGKAELDPRRRMILHFPEDNAIWSVGFGYGGSALLGKQCMSLRMASWQARQEGWLAEPMLLIGIEDPAGRTDYVAAALPSACGKTSLAMLIPPQALKAKGWKVWTVGDDVAWLRAGPDGRLWALNPKAGLFAVAPGTNSRSNPNALAAARRDSIFTNVMLGEDKTVWWERGDGEPPARGTDWQGNPWKPGLMDESGRPVLGAHPTGRFTAPFSQGPRASPRGHDPEGVPVSAIVFGGRRARLAPLAAQSFDWDHGVYAGASVASERTAAAGGRAGEVRRDPMAMIPFCGYNMGDYFSHWLAMGRRIPSPPKIFSVNWFRRDEQGRLLWPGYGENLRVLGWMLARCRGEGKARQTPVGWVPAEGALDMTGLDLPPGTMDKLLAVDTADWREELADQRRFFARLEGRLDPELPRQQSLLEERLSACPATSS